MRLGILPWLPLLFCLPALALAQPAGEAAPGEEARRLIDELASEDYATRTKAYRSLDLIGEPAIPLLEKALTHADPEVVRQVRRLLRLIRRRGQAALLSALDRSRTEFERSGDVDRMLSLGREILPALHRVLDEEDAKGQSYSYDRLSNTYRVIAGLAVEDDRETLIARLSGSNIHHRLQVRQILETFDPGPTNEAVLARLCDPEENAQVRAHLLELSLNSRFGREDERYTAIAEDLLDDPRPLVRSAALRFFLRRAVDGVRRKVIALTRDDIPEVRKEACRTLRSYPGDTAAAALRERLLDPAPEVKAAAIETLGTVGGPDIAPLLRPFLKEPDTMVRSTTARVLARFGDQAALPVLIELLTERGEEFLTYSLHAIVDAVGTIGDRAALEPLLVLLDDAGEYDRIATYRYLILRSIVQVGGAAVLPRIRKALVDPGIQNRSIVLDAVSAIDSDEVIPILMSALETGDTRLRTSAVRALVKREHAPAAPLIASLLGEEDDAWFLSEAVRALSRFGDASCVPALLELLDLPADDQQRTSLFYALFQAMARFCVRDAAPRIAEITSSHPNYRDLGIDTLGRLGNPEVVPTLLEMLEGSPSDGTRWRTLLALARLGRREPLAERLESSPSISENQKIDALIALGKLDEAERFLREVLTSQQRFDTWHYNLACVLALKGRLDAALAALEKAHAIRSLRRDILLTDPDLASLRADPRFAELVKLCR